MGMVMCRDKALNYHCFTSDIVATCTTFKVFTYDSIWAENRTNYFSQHQADALRVTLQYKSYLLTMVLERTHRLTLNISIRKSKNSFPLRFHE